MLTKEEKVFILRLIDSIRNWNGDMQSAAKDIATAQSVKQKLILELQEELKQDASQP